MYKSPQGKIGITRPANIFTLLMTEGIKYQDKEEREIQTKKKKKWGLKMIKKIKEIGKKAKILDRAKKKVKNARRAHKKKRKNNHNKKKH